MDLFFHPSKLAFLPPSLKKKTKRILFPAWGICSLVWRWELRSSRGFFFRGCRAPKNEFIWVIPLCGLFHGFCGCRDGIFWSNPSGIVSRSGRASLLKTGMGFNPVRVLKHPRTFPRLKINPELGMAASPLMW